MSMLPTPLRPSSIWGGFVFVALIFFALWMHDLGRVPYSADESFIALRAQQSAGEILARLNTDEPHPPIYYLSQRGLQVLTGSVHEFVLRLPSVWAGMLLLAIVFRLGRGVEIGRNHLILLLLLIGLNPHLTVHVREARMYSYLAAAVAFAFLVALRFEHLPRRQRVAWLIFATLTAALTHYFAVFFLAAIGLYGLLHLRGSLRTQWLIGQIIAGGLFLLWLILGGRGFFNGTSIGEGKSWSFTLPIWENWQLIWRTGLFGYRFYPEQAALAVGGTILFFVATCVAL
ncbi:MAG: phospholipid carrier-dependent glycosyltransferase, partial [Candidatus Promineifilaceae bacterium]